MDKWNTTNETLESVGANVGIVDTWFFPPRVDPDAMDGGISTHKKKNGEIGWEKGPLAIPFQCLSYWLENLSLIIKLEF